MHATAQRLHSPFPASPSPARATPRPALRALPAPGRRRRLPSAATVALYAVGLTAGFLLAAIASAPGGDEIVSGQMRLAGAAALVGVLALLRARAVARRRPARRRPTATL